jgi:uncharacterized protein (DUF305 family)
MRIRHRLPLISGALAIGLAAISATAQVAQHVPAQPHAGDGMMGMHGAAMQTAMQNMQQGMDMPMSGDPDPDFAQMMIPHHQGAIEMVRIELESGKDSQLRQMAQKIIEDPEREIAALKEWLAQHGK